MTNLSLFLTQLMLYKFSVQQPQIQCTTLPSSKRVGYTVAMKTGSLVLGAGRIGQLIAWMLAKALGQRVIVVDRQIEPLASEQGLPFEYQACDVKDADALSKLLSAVQCQTVVSALPYFLSPIVAKQAKRFEMHYFDLTEDVEAVQKIRTLACNANTAFVPSCGLAPGLVGLIAHAFIKSSGSPVQTAHLRAGCIPIEPNNALEYALSWSPEGLVNQYARDGYCLVQGRLTRVPSLHNLEVLKIGGKTYEAFSTSGGVGTLVEEHEGNVQELNYKTIRYSGHCEKMRFLMEDLKLKDDPLTLVRILKQALPHHVPVKVLVHISVEAEHFNRQYIKTFYPSNLYGKSWSSIQAVTAASACAVIEQVLKQPGQYQGFVHQHHIAWSDILDGTFASILKED